MLIKEIVTIYFLFFFCNLKMKLFYSRIISQGAAALLESSVTGYTRRIKQTIQDFFFFKVSSKSTIVQFCFLITQTVG